VSHASGGEVVGRRGVPLRHREARRRLVVRVHARRAIGSQHRVAEGLAVIARRVVVARDVRDGRRRAELQRSGNAAVQVRPRAVGNRAARGLGQYGVCEVVFASAVPLDAHEDRGGHAFVERALDRLRLSRSRGDEQVGVERAAE